MDYRNMTEEQRRNNLDAKIIYDFYWHVHAKTPQDSPFWQGADDYCSAGINTRLVNEAQHKVGLLCMETDPEVWCEIIKTIEEIGRIEGRQHANV